MREAGALTVLPLALSANIVALIFAGELAAAGALLDEVRRDRGDRDASWRPTAR